MPHHHGRPDQRWLIVLVAAVLLIGGGVYCWQLPWTRAAVVVGQVWTPHLALAMVATGISGLASTVVAGVVALFKRWRTRSWAFELAAMSITGIALVWLLGLSVTAFGLIPADAHFNEVQRGGRRLVVRTTTSPDAVTCTIGVRHGLVVWWGESDIARR